MPWKIEISLRAEKSLKRLDSGVRARILRFLKERIASANDPRELARPLKGEKGGLWRFRVGDYRIICDIRENQVRILVLTVGHRRDVYR